MTRKERKSQGIYKTTKGQYFQCYYDEEGCTTMSPLFDSPEEVVAWFRRTG